MRCRPLRADADGFTIDDGVLVSYPGGLAAWVRIPEGDRDQHERLQRYAGDQRVDPREVFAQSTALLSPASRSQSPSRMRTHLAAGDDRRRAFAYTPLESVTLDPQDGRPRTFSDMDKLRSVHVGPNVQADGLFRNICTRSWRASELTRTDYQSLDDCPATKDLTHLATYPQAKNSGRLVHRCREPHSSTRNCFASAQITSGPPPRICVTLAKGAFVGARITSLTLP